MATQRETVIALAKKELGYKESSNGWTKFGQWFAEYMHCENQGFENADWCAMFCAWCMQKAGLTSGQTVFTASAGPTGEALWKNKGLWKNASYTPKVGDLIHFTWGHVGLVEKVSGNTVHTIEGNYSNTVAQRSYSLSYSGIRGYAAPKYKEESGLLSSSDNPEQVYLTQILPDKMRFNLAYLPRAGVLADIKIIGRSIACLFKKGNSN